MKTETELIDDGLLLRRMMAGDEDSFTFLYRRRHPAIYRFALHMSGNVALAEDVTQEVFMTLLRDAKKFDPARGTLSGFLFGIARNHLRRRWKRVALEWKWKRKWARAVFGEPGRICVAGNCGTRSPSDRNAAAELSRRGDSVRAGRDEL